MGQCTFLNASGDITIAWDGNKETEKSMKAFIREKMNEGVVFFVIEEKSFLNLFKYDKKSELKNENDLKSGSKLVIKDKDVDKVLYRLGDPKISKVVRSGSAKISNNVIDINKAKKRITKDVDDVYKNKSIAVKRPMGG